MKTSLLLLLIVPCMAQAQAASTLKPCSELKSEIAAKIEANGVKAYTLTILPANTTTDDRIVGSCDGGTQRIAYRRATEPAASPQGLAAASR